MIYRLLIVLLTIWLFPALGYSLSLEDKLQRIIDIYSLKNEICSDELQNVNFQLSNIGKELFRSKALSGDKDTSCSTCHIEESHLIDGLPVSIGVGGRGEGFDRLDSQGVIVPRNSFTLIGRAHKNYQAYFWDGKIELESSGDVISPFGIHVDKKFETLLSVAAVMPLLARDEFLGRIRLLDENDHVRRVNDLYYQDRYKAASILIKEKINNDKELKLIKEGFKNNGIEIETLTLADIGNALAAFIATDFSCHESRWNDYLAGKKDSLTPAEKRGAILFYGKARCAGCHSGFLFSDFEYHSIASPQGAFGTAPLGQDIGRAAVTDLATDRYKFRTPPLLDVKNTAPYGHSGQFKTLTEVVMHHFNPIVIFQHRKWSSEKEQIDYGKILGQRDDILTYYDIDNQSEISDLIKFLNSI